MHQDIKRFRKNFKGSILIIGMLFALVVTFGVAHLILMKINYHKSNMKQLNRTKALFYAQSGIQLALHELRHKNSSDRFHNSWGIAGTTYTYTDSDGTQYIVEIEGLPS